MKFTVKNYKTFKDKTVFSFIASAYDKETLEDSNVFHNDKFNLRILKSAAVYGANASGKTKLIDAFYTMRRMVLSSSKDSQKNDPIDVQPFLLSEETYSEPSEFEVYFIFGDTLYRYGFEANSEFIISEWLYRRAHTKEVEVFYRDQDDIDVHERIFRKGSMLSRENLVRKNALLLSVAAQFNDDIAGKVVSWFNSMGILSGIRDMDYKGFTMGLLMDPERKKTILNLLSSADLGIRDVNIEKMDIDSIPKDMPAELRNNIIDEIQNEQSVYLGDCTTTHIRYNKELENIGKVSFNMEDDESHGTKKFFYLLGPILDSLERGSLLIIDELDSRLHPNLVEKLVVLFNSKEINRLNSQLIFNTHSTKIMNSDKFRRDQQWFVEKDQYGVSRLYSLSDFSSSELRKGENFEKKYLEGRYGAIPYLNTLEKQLQKDLEMLHENAK